MTDFQKFSKLSDALAEMGQPHLANHFRELEEHKLMPIFELTEDGLWWGRAMADGAEWQLFNVVEAHGVNGPFLQACHVRSYNRFRVTEMGDMEWIKAEPPPTQRRENPA